MENGPLGHPGTPDDGDWAPANPPGRRHAAWETPSDRAVRALEGWLNRAMEMPEGTYPRIPLRLSREGGWGAVLNTQTGRAWAEGWWATAFAGIEVDR